MPRTPRLDFPGARHHCMNRGARREAMFLDDDCCALFLDALAELPERFGSRLHGYALMPNHYHLMIEVPRGNLSEVMRFVGASFTQAWNRSRGHDGPVFRGRFRNEVVQDDAYWMHLLAYLHLNPVKARLVKHPHECAWTSHGAYRDARLQPDWLVCDELIALFGSREAALDYIEEVRIGRREPPKGFDADRFWSASNTVEVPERRPESLRTPEQALDDVASVLGLPRDGLLERSPKPVGHLGTWLAVWWLQRGAGQSQAAIARQLGVSRPRVGQIRKRFGEEAHADEGLRDAMGRLEQLLLS